MKGTLGLKKGSVRFKNDLETTLVVMYLYYIQPYLYEQSPSLGWSPAYNSHPEVLITRTSTKFSLSTTTCLV